jgi:hypothetical protein
VLLLLIKNDWNILTILPWWKVEEWESRISCLRREIYEELWIFNIKIINKLFKIYWYSPSSNIKSNVILFSVDIWTTKIKTNAEVSNPRYLDLQEILDLETTTKLTKKIVNYLIFLPHNE